MAFGTMIIAGAIHFCSSAAGHQTDYCFHNYGNEQRHEIKISNEELKELTQLQDRVSRRFNSFFDSAGNPYGMEDHWSVNERGDCEDRVLAMLEYLRTHNPSLYRNATPVIFDIERSGHVRLAHMVLRIDTTNHGTLWLDPATRRMNFRLHSNRLNENAGFYPTGSVSEPWVRREER